jgi:hypothetical protein
MAMQLGFRPSACWSRQSPECFGHGSSSFFDAPDCIQSMSPVGEFLPHNFCRPKFPCQSQIARAANIFSSTGMQPAGAKMAIIKIDVAEREIVAAVQLLFDGGDAIRVYALAAAAREITTTLCEKRGKR